MVTLILTLSLLSILGLEKITPSIALLCWWVEVSKDGEGLHIECLFLNGNQFCEFIVNDKWYPTLCMHDRFQLFISSSNEVIYCWSFSVGRQCLWCQVAWQEKRAGVKPCCGWQSVEQDSESLPFLVSPLGSSISGRVSHYYVNIVVAITNKGSPLIR